MKEGVVHTWLESDTEFFEESYDVLNLRNPFDLGLYANESSLMYSLWSNLFAFVYLDGLVFLLQNWQVDLHYPQFVYNVYNCI